MLLRLAQVYGARKELAELLTEPLSTIYHQSWLTRKVRGNATPVYQTGGRMWELQACRPDLGAGEAHTSFHHSDGFQDNQEIRPTQHGFVKDPDQLGLL